MVSVVRLTKDQTDDFMVITFTAKLPTTAQLAVSRAEGDDILLSGDKLIFFSHSKCNERK